jgi:ribosome-binding protein aMBF1 (putative translation factor)
MEGLALLGNAQRTLRCRRSLDLSHGDGCRRSPAFRKPLGEYIRKKRLDLSLSLRQLAKLLELGNSKELIRKWESNRCYPTERYRVRIIEFLGFDPESNKPTGDIL